MAMEADNALEIASIRKSELLDPEPPEDEFEFENEIDEYCELEAQYIPGSLPNSPGVLYPICIGDLIHHSRARYEIVHRLGSGAFSVVWLARDLDRNKSVVIKIMVEGSEGEKEFANQKMLKEVGALENSGLHLYQETFLLKSPYNEMGEDGNSDKFHRVLVLPPAGPELSKEDVGLHRSIRSRMAAAKSLLEALRDLYKAGFVHGDLNVGSVHWKIDPGFAQEIANSPDEAFGGPPGRLKLPEGEGLKAGHRVLPAEFPRHKLDSQVVLSDFRLLRRADETAVDNKFQGIPGYIAPECYHGSDPSQASDMWNFMMIFVYLYLGDHAFNDPTNIVPSPSQALNDIRDQLGPLPTAWTKPDYDSHKNLYASPAEANLPDPPASKFAARLHDNWQKVIPGWLDYEKTPPARIDWGPRDEERVKRWEQEYEVKQEAEVHALEVIHSVFRYQPDRRLTAEQLLASPHWVRLMQICGVQAGQNGAR